MTRAFHGVRVMAWLIIFAFCASTGATEAGAQATVIVPTPGDIGSGGLGTVTTQAGNTTNITGGLRPGNGPNVFHSFNQFSVGQGHTAAFLNPGGAARVISRVIGGSPSNINGTIQALGWNLYFMNPSGIIFGPSANLNVSGSAYFSTANHLTLADGKVFSANLVALDATLSTATPAAFGFVGPGAPAPIVISGSTLRVSDNTTLMLAGGDVQLDGARISAQRTVVGAVGGGAQVNVDPGAGNAFSVNTPAGTLSASVGTSIQAGFAAEVFPANIVVPAGAQVNRTTGPFGFLTGLEVVGGTSNVPPGNSGLPPVVFPAANAGAPAPVLNQNPVNPVVYLNRAVTLMPQDTPAPPAALLTSRCAGGDKGEFSSFVQATRDVTPPQPGNTMASPFIWEEPGVRSSPGAGAVSSSPKTSALLSVNTGAMLGCGS